jgi:hypothetical protein
MNITINQKPLIEVRGFNGLYARGSEATTPSDHLTECMNCIFPGENQVGIREPFTIQNEIPGRSIISFFIASVKTGAALLTLNSNGQFWDETHNQLLTTIPGADDFTAINVFGRTYISFKKFGKAYSNYTYYYDGNFLVAASINAPITAPALSQVNAGIVDIGVHTVAVSFINENGALSPPSPTNNINSDGAHTITIGIPIGPPNCIGRQILVSKANESELFFGPVVHDNSTIILEYNDFDTTLITSADYLNNILGRVPACASLKYYKSRLVLIGQINAPDDILISRQNEPETFDIINGTVHFPVNYGVNTCLGGLIIRSVLYITKPNGTYSTQDNGSDPATWNVDVTDSGIGAFENGISTFATDMSAQDVLDSSLICNKRGLIFFNGAYADTALSWKIESLWQKISEDLFYKVCLAHDVWSKRVYISVPLGITDDTIVLSQDNRIILMMDYSHSLSPSTVRWSVWFIDGVGNYAKIKMENFTLDYGSPRMIYQLAITCGQSQIYKINPGIAPLTQDQLNLSPSLVSIRQSVTLAPVIRGGLTTYTMLNLEISGTNQLNIDLYNKYRTFFRSVRGFNLSLYSFVQRYEFQRLINFVDEGMQVKLSGSGFLLSRVDIYGTVMFNMRPALIEQS